MAIDLDKVLGTDPNNPPKRLRSSGARAIDDLARDALGFHHAILTKAGITPSGTPDNALASQILQGLEQLSGTRVADYATARALDSSTLTDGQRISINGFPYPWEVKTGTVTDNGWYIVFADDSNRYLESTSDIAYLGIFKKSDGEPAVGDGVADDDLAVTNAWAFGNVVIEKNRTYKFTTAITKIASSFSFKGEDIYTSILLYAGANTTNDIITIGDGVSTYINIDVSGFTLQSDTVMTAGCGVHVKRLARSTVAPRIQGQDKYESSGNNFYHGIWFDAVDVVSTIPRDLYAQADGIRLNGAISGPKADLFFEGHSKIAQCAVGLRVGGAFGGVYLSSGMSFINNGTNVVADQSLVAETNREIFVDGGVYDVTTTGPSFYLDDPGNLLVTLRPDWIASAATHGVHTSSNFDGKCIIATRIFNCGGDGVRVDNANAVVTVSEQIHDCGGYGVNPNVASHKVLTGNVYFANNSSGNINTTYSPSVHLITEDKQIRTTIPTVDFVTNGDFSPTYNSQICRYSNNGERIKFYLEINFDTNAYTTASGVFRIKHGLTSPAYDTPVTLGRVNNATFNTARQHQAEISGASIVIRAHSSTGAAVEWDTTNIPASKSSILIRISGEYEY